MDSLEWFNTIEFAYKTNYLFTIKIIKSFLKQPQYSKLLLKSDK